MKFTSTGPFVPSFMDQGTNAEPVPSRKLVAVAHKIPKHKLTHCSSCSRRRRRTHDRHGPMKFEQSGLGLRIEQPRCSSPSLVVNAVLILLLLTPTKRAPWYECVTSSYCPWCKHIESDKYKRQFSISRRILFVIWQRIESLCIGH